MSRSSLAFLIGLLGFIAYIGAVVALGDVVVHRHWLLQLLYYLVAGVVYALGIHLAARWWEQRRERRRDAAAGGRDAGSDPVDATSGSGQRVASGARVTRDNGGSSGTDGTGVAV